MHASRLRILAWLGVAYRGSGAMIIGKVYGACNRMEND